MIRRKTMAEVIGYRLLSASRC